LYKDGFLRTEKNREYKISKRYNETQLTTPEQLFRHLFEACNILRGPINQDEYKSYITPLLFFKRLCDVFDEDVRKALGVSDGDENYAYSSINHLFLIPKGCHWNDIRNVSVNIGNVITKAMLGVERANPETLHGVFTSFDEAVWNDKTKFSDERLKDLVEHFSKINVGNDNYTQDVMGDAYEYLIKKFADLSKKNAGEFYTPRSIVKLLVMLLNPIAGETIYDPATGTGGMLIEAIRYMHNDRKTYGKIYGQEKNLVNSAISRMNLFLHGAIDFHIEQGDTLRSPSFIENNKLKTFDCVIANPPFSLKNWGASAFSTDRYGRNIWSSPSDKNGDYAWLQHMVKSMDDKNGRLAVVLPQGVLFRTGNEGNIRKNMILSDMLEYVIALKNGIFYSTGVSACILILNNKKQSSHKDKVCLLDASEIFTPQRAQNIMTEENIQEVFKLCKDYANVLDRVKIVTNDDLKANDFSLSVSLYLDKKSKESIDPETLKKGFLKAVDDVRQAEGMLKNLLDNFEFGSQDNEQ
jgi:type I restriction enzyme M protein